MFRGLVFKAAAWLHSAKLRWAWLWALLAYCLIAASPQLSHAIPPLVTAPELAKLSQSNAKAVVDMRRHWQASVIGVTNLLSTQASDPQELWSIPDAEFKPLSEAARLVLTPSQRYVARLNMTSTGSGSTLNLSLMMPRLDAVHLAYRYNDEPWTIEAAGDTIPMQKWAYSDRQPSFDIPLRPGNLNIVLEVAHLGIVDAPMVLQSASSYRDERLIMGLSVGVLIGVNLVLGLIGVAASLAFRRASFLAIPLMTVWMAIVVAANSGIAGVYLFNHSSSFNDEIKFFAITVWCVVLPWVTVVVLSLRHRAPLVWAAALAWGVLGSIGAAVWMDYTHRGTALNAVPILAISTVLFSLGILVFAAMRKEAYAVVTAPGVLLYASALLAPLGTYLGYLSNDDTILYSALATMLAALLFLQVLVYRHRHGRLVMSRAQTSPHRDVLTGLLNRKGFIYALAHNVRRMKTEKAYAIFMYISVGRLDNMREGYGEEGFDAGMVQLAAALSSSVTMVDTVARVAPNAFALNVLMPRDTQQANRLAQKILTRTMTLATHSAPMAQTARIAIAWMPMFGIELPDLERRALRSLSKMPDNKRIAWVGGDLAQAELSQSPDDLSMPTTKPNHGQEADDLPSLPGVINRLERDMLGADGEGIEWEANKLLQQLKSNEKI
jgi:GGDEF domain-containing protein